MRQSYITLNPADAFAPAPTTCAELRTMKLEDDIYAYDEDVGWILDEMEFGDNLDCVPDEDLTVFEEEPDVYSFEPDYEGDEDEAELHRVCGDDVANEILGTEVYL